MKKEDFIKEINKLYKQDQKDRDFDFHNPPPKEVLMEVGQRDEERRDKLIELIKKNGTVTAPEYGEDVANKVWVMFAHATQHQVDQLEFYYNSIKDIYGAIEPTKYALMTDQLMKYKEKPQVYGTKFVWDEDKKQWIPYTIKDQKNVNDLRAKMGFDTTVEERELELNSNDKNYLVK